MGVLVILTPGFPENERDSSCLPAVQKFAISLKKLHNNRRIVVISFQYPFVAKNYSWNGIEVIAIGGRNNSKLRRLFTWLKVYKHLTLLKKENTLVGILSLWVGECALVGNYFSKKYNLKHFIWIHGQDAKLNNHYVKRVKPKSEQLIAISHFIKEEFYKNHKISPFLIAENGIIESEFPSLNKGNRSIDILGVGSLIKLKNYNLFIDCILELKQIYPKIQAAIAGEGEEYTTLKTQIDACGLQTNVQLLGAQSHATVLELLNQSKIFLHTSHYEGNSSALIEALYSGCEVTSTCALGPETPKHLTVCITKQELLQSLHASLNKETSPERVLFNSMDSTAKKISQLYN